MHIFLSILKWTCITIVTALCWVPVTYAAVDKMARKGWFGSCFEGACAYGAIFVGFPVMMVVATTSTVLLIAVILNRYAARKRKV